MVKQNPSVNVDETSKTSKIRIEELLPRAGAPVTSPHIKTTLGFLTIQLSLYF